LGIGQMEHLPARFLGGCVHRERERKRRSPNSSV
jgi:hypothetical protein